MKRRPFSRLAVLLAMATLPACHRASVSPAAGAPATTMTTSARPDSVQRRGYAAADVRFMHHMLMHHGQALAMTAMVPSRSVREDVRTVAERITISQRDEMALMQRWLRARGESVPDDHAAHGGMAAMSGGMHATGDSSHAASHAAMMAAMPGMLTPDEMRQLAASTGAAFDTLFVRGMIKHHEGALQMVKEYLATPGAAQETEIFRFASDVDADQRAEIRRLRGLLSQ